MKNLKYLNFDRNRYFYGKLLSVDDFELEQRYMNDKRRMLNRFIHGTGIVCGMNVVPIDDETISVEAGIALDFAGREIVMNQPVVKKLSVIDGYESLPGDDKDGTHLYLCVMYDEQEKEMVHSIAGAKAMGEQRVEYGKYAEGYHLYLTSREPENDNLSSRGLFEETRTIYWANGVRISHVTPKYVPENQEFELKIIVEDTGNSKTIDFKYDLNLVCIQDQGVETTTIEFHEDEHEKAGYYEIVKRLKTIPAEDVVGKLSVNSESFYLNIDNVTVHGTASGSNAIRIISGTVKEEVEKRYYQTAMDSILNDANKTPIYLARLDVIRTGDSCIIEEIINAPFHQYVYNNTLAAAMNELTSPYPVTPVVFNRSDRGAGAERTNASGYQITTGTAVIDLGIGSVEGQKFFSAEIPHGLGLGLVHITLGEAYSLKDQSHVVYGNSDIFEEKQEVVKAELAAKVYVEKGTFQIGIRCKEATTQTKLKIHWMAVKDPKEQMIEKSVHSLQIKPDILNLAVRETYYLEALIDGESQSRIHWSLREEDGGSIDSNGMYTAPNKVGVYEVLAESMDEPGLKASALIVVRDV